MIINHNITALNTHNKLSSASAAQGKSMEKLASGLRINKAGDDAAGLAISEKMRAQVRGLDQASRNAQDGISLVQTAEGALNETHDILQRMREISVQSTNGTATDDDRKALQDEVKQLKSEVDRIGNNTEFNTKKLINGELSGSQLSGVGSKIGTSTSAKSDTGWIDVTNTETTSTTNKFQLNLDGKTLDFDLAGAATDTLGQMEEFKTAINNAITTYNSTAAEADKIVAPKINLDVRTNAGATEVKLSLESGTTGSKSQIEIKALDDAAGTGALASTDAKTKMITTAVNGSDGQLSDALSGVSGKLSLDVNGTKIDVDLTTVAGGTYNADSEMTAVAGNLKTDINKALSDYKNLTGTDYGTVDVTVKDGSLVVSSSKADTVNVKFGVDANSTKLGLAGTASSTSGGLDFQIGANKGQSINLQLNDMSTKGLKIADLDVSTSAGADNAIKSLDDAIKNVSTERSKLGAVQNRLDHTINNLKTSSENLTAAESRIRDVDMAKEMMNQTKNSILAQAAQAMLAQSNQTPQGVLQLLR